MPVFTRRTLALVAILILNVSFAVAQSVPTSKTDSVNQAQTSDDQNDLAALKADVAKMKVLIMQMQNNLGLTTNSTTPLYHQFELEIDMWQIVMTQMERRIEHMEQGAGPRKRE